VEILYCRGSAIKIGTESGKDIDKKAKCFASKKLKNPFLAVLLQKSNNKINARYCF
jgi:hypothetical protein